MIGPVLSISTNHQHKPRFLLAKRAYLDISFTFMTPRSPEGHAVPGDRGRQFLYLFNAHGDGAVEMRGKTKGRMTCLRQTERPSQERPLGDKRPGENVEQLYFDSVTFRVVARREACSAPRIGAEWRRVEHECHKWTNPTNCTEIYRKGIREIRTFVPFVMKIEMFGKKRPILNRAPLLGCQASHWGPQDVS
jgi:hypothetical protein